MRLGLCVEPLVDQLGFEGALERAAALGYDGVELTAWDAGGSMLDAPEEEVREAARLVESAGLDVVGVYRYFPDGTTGYGVTHPDPEIRSRTVEYLRRVVELCGRLGGSVIVFGSPEQRSVPAGATAEEAWENARETFADDRLLDALRAHGVALCIEPLTWKTDFLDTTAEALSFVREVDHPNVRTMVDGHHLLREGSPDDIPGVIRDCGPYLGHVHADDASMRGPGGGDLDWGPIVAALRDIGYDGYLSVETHDVYVEGVEIADYEACLERSVDYLRGVLDG